ncbi:MAG: transglycosylase SLT domain-containing protein [Candidatus Wallbacteria bacterium]|nr:transglycosylase SLT domain-containing protein [Candidatus Wallbacteria bacterium]
MKAIFLVFLLYFSGFCHAAIYSYRDSHGNVYITDKPQSEDYQILVTTSKQPRRLLSSKGYYTLMETGEKYQDSVALYSEKYELPPALVLAIIKAESNFDPKAVSKKGAMGLMQLMPVICEKCGVKDPYDPEQNVQGGTSYFSELLVRFKNVNLALAAYNAGPSRVIQYNGIPPYEETRNYVKKVNFYYKYYQQNGKNLKEIGLNSCFKDGFANYQKDNLGEAVRDFETVAVKYPNAPEVNYNLALAYDLKAEYSQAVVYYLKALSLDPFLKEAYYNLAIIYEKIGLNFKAISTWQKYMEFELNPDIIKEIKGYVKELIKVITQKSD